MGLLGSHQEGEAGGEQTGAVVVRGAFLTKRDREDEEGAQSQPPVDDSGSESESGAETDDEASSASDYPPHLAGPPPAEVAASLLKSRGTRPPRYSAGGGEDSGHSEMVEKVSHLDLSKEGTSVGASAAAAASPCVSTLPQGTSATPPSLPTIQLPHVQARGSSGEESNGGNEPDISASVSESEGTGLLHPQSSDNFPYKAPEGLLHLPNRTAQSLGGKRGEGELKSNESESESESSSTEFVEGDLEDLSQQNKLHRPHRDRRRDQSEDTKSGSLSTTTASLSISANSFLYGESASDRVRHLVKRSVSKKRKQQQRQGRPKRETKAPSAGGRRSKKSNRNVVKHSVDTTIF